MSIKSAVAADSIRKGKLEKNFTLEELREIARQNDEGEIGDVEVSAIRTLDTEFRNTNSELLLFEETIRDDDERFDRLEKVVQEIYTNLSQLTPGINRLLAIENDIKELHDQLSQLVAGGPGVRQPPSRDTIAMSPQDSATGNVGTLTRQNEVTNRVVSDENIVDDVDDTLPPVVQEAPVPVPAPQPVQQEIIVEKEAPIQSIERTSHSISSANIRASESPSKTRIVFETPVKGRFDLDYNAQEQTLTLTADSALPLALVDGLVRKSSQISKVESSISGNGDSTLILFSLRNVSDVSPGYHLPPKTQGGKPRYYFDIFK